MKRKCSLSDNDRKVGLQKCLEIHAISALKRQENYNLLPNKCSACGCSLPYRKRHNKFCSHSCSASIGNIGVSRNLSSRKYVSKACVCCGTITTNSKFCSPDCFAKYRWEQRVKLIEATGCLVNYRADKRYLEQKRGRKWETCGVSEWLGKPVPLILDHVDGNSDNNQLINVRLLCPNCNAFTPTFCGKNKGNGRSKRKDYRNKRYAAGMSY